MENFQEFDRDQKQNWLKGVVALICLQKPLELFIDGELEVFHGKLSSDFGQDHCMKECDFKSWKPRPNQIPPLECEVCSRWRDAIWANHTSRHGKVMWLNSKPHLWSKEKWEVAKVFMPDGHKNHNSAGDFDIAALLCLMNQCQHFKKFELGALCDKVACVRNKIMHAPRCQLEQMDMVDYFNRIRELGDVLARHEPKFRGLSQDIDEIQKLNYRLILPDSIVAQRILAKDEKELEEIFFEAAEHQLTRMKLEKLKRQLAQLQEVNRADYYALIHIPRGLCVIFNNEEFLGTLGRRRGSHQDERALSNVFSRLGFEVVTYRNMTARDMQRELKNLGSRNFMNDDALVVCVLSHGETGYVFGSDEQLVALREVTQPFTSGEAPTLAGKPKLFFIQACQGQSYQRGSVPCLSRPRHGEEDRWIPLEDDAGRVVAGRVVAGPEVAGPEVAGPEVAGPEVAGPEVAGPEVAGPEVAGPEVAGPEVARPEVARPEVARPEVANCEDAGHPGSMPVLDDTARVHAETVPWGADFLLGMATVSEFKSFRHTSTGSIYIQELCRQLTKSAESLYNDDIHTVLTNVNREVSRGDFLNYKQIPEPKYTLTKKLVLKFV